MNTNKDHSEQRKDSIEGQTIKEQLAETNPSKSHVDQHHGESTKSPQEDRNIGQSNGAGRPPLMKK